MKKSIFLVLLISISINAYSEILKIHFSNEEFAENTYVIRYNPDDQKLVEPLQLESHRYNYCIEDKDKQYVIKYILFSETPEIEKHDIEFTVLSSTVLFNIHGTDEFESNSTMFKAEDVKNEFNADKGFTNFAYDIKSDYAGEYKFIMTNFLYKKGLGIMCQTIQFNDMEFAKTEKFFEIFHGFNFY
ncbi:MAG: hypothetical protein OCD02_10290 [Spirochaetaceae bacterium]